MDNVATTLKKLREFKNLTQGELADRLGVSRSTIAMLERKERQPSSDLLIKLSDFFGVTTDIILGKENAPRLSDTSTGEVNEESPEYVSELENKTDKENESDLQKAIKTIDKSVKHKIGETSTSDMLTALLLKRLIEEGIIPENGEIDIETLDMIKDAIKLDAKMNKNLKKGSNK